jgi:glycosyltransferase involved in cell wall biosynthesis
MMTARASPQDRSEGSCGTDLPVLPMPRHVLHVVLTLEGGGLERFVLSLAKRAQRHGQRASILCLERPGRLALEAIQHGIEVLCVHKQPGFRLKTIRDIRSVILEARPEVVHTHQLGALFYAGAAARRCGLPVLHTEHGRGIRTNKQKLLAWWAAGYAQKICCVSAEIATALSGLRISPDKLEVVPNGIDFPAGENAQTRLAIRKEAGIPGDAFVLGTVGRLARIKRQDLLLDVFAQVSRQVSRAYLLLVGDGPERQNLGAHAEALKLADRVVFCGWQDQPSSFLTAMDCFLLTSESEGLPLALLEAWAAGVPVVTFSVGGLSQAVRHAENGLLSPLGNVDEMARQVVALAHDAPTARRIALSGQGEVRRRYALDITAEAYQHRYRQIMTEAAPVSRDRLVPEAPA